MPRRSVGFREDSPSVALSDLKTSYLLDEDLVLSDLPAGTARVVARSAAGSVWEAGAVGTDMDLSTVVLSGIAAGTHAVEVWSADGQLLDEELTTVTAHPGDNPVPGFATSFDEASTERVIDWLRALRCTVVQVYDWMASYSAPLGPPQGWADPLGRPISRVALRRLIDGIRGLGAVAQAYSPVYAVDPTFAADHPNWLLYRGDGQPESLGDLLQLADPGCPEWQQHWLATYGGAADELGFNGFHLDTYGYPRAALDADGDPVDLASGYAAFVDAVRAGRPRDVLSFNQVNGVPRAFSPPTAPGFRYVEVWPPNGQWRHLEGLLARSAGSGPRQGDTLAIYPPVWESERAAALRTVVLSQAIATVLGANALLYGDVAGVLRHPYYPNHEQLDIDEQREVLTWNRFALRCRDLFAGSLDTSWYEIHDENGAVAVAWSGTVSPEPVGGVLFARVVHHGDTTIVSLLDLTGSSDGSWASPTLPGSCRQVTITMLVNTPELCSVEAAVLGIGGGRFHPVSHVETAHREGRAIQIDVPLIAGWSVVRVGTA
jgi:dextranase